MKQVRDGLIAGLFAGLVLACIYFMDYGPGNALHNPAQWLGLDSADAGKYVGFLLWILLGGASGVLFGALQRRGEPSIARALLLGAGTGLLLWIIVRLLFGTLLHQYGLDFGAFLFSIVTFLLFGVVLGTFYFYRTQPAIQIQGE